MPHALLLAALAPALPVVLAGSSDPGTPPLARSAPEVRLLATLPSDAVAAVHVADVAGLVSRREANAWLALLGAPEWQRALAAARDADDADASGDGRARELSAELLGALAAAESALAFAQPQPAAAPALVVVLRGGAGLEAPLSALLFGAAAPVQAGDATLWAADAGVIEAYLRRGDLHIAVDAADAATAARVARETLARHDAGAAPQGRLAALLGAGDATFAADLAPLWRTFAAEVPAPFTSVWDAWSSISWLRGSVRFGAGETLDITVEAPYGEGLAARFFDTLRPCDPRSMALAPLVSAAVSVAQIDLRKCFDLVLAEFAAQDRERHDALRAALAGTKDSLGFDVEGELLGSFSGSMLSFTLPSDSGALTVSGRGVEQLAAVAPSCTAFEISDPEPFFSAVELAATFLGGTAESRSLHGAEVYTLAAEPPLLVAIGAPYLCISTNADALESFLALAAEAEDAPAGFLTRASHNAALEGLGGVYVSLASTNMLLAGYGDVLRSLEVLLAGLVEAPARVLRTAQEIGDLLESRGLAGFKGTLRTRLERDSGRIRWQLEAR